jgi:hypothetical protein
MDAAGYKVGWSLAERLTFRSCSNLPLLGFHTVHLALIYQFCYRIGYPGINHEYQKRFQTPLKLWSLSVKTCISKHLFFKWLNERALRWLLSAFVGYSNPSWTAMYNKQVDNLRTNHRGIYVIQDHSYRAFLRVSVPKGYESEMDEMCRKVSLIVPLSSFWLAAADLFRAMPMPKMVIFPSAVIRGALMNLGVQSVVSVEIAIPQCEYLILSSLDTSDLFLPVFYH